MKSKIAPLADDQNKRRKKRRQLNSHAPPNTHEYPATVTFRVGKGDQSSKNAKLKWLPVPAIAKRKKKKTTRLCPENRSREVD